ncbi:MAG: hemolysin family protein [Caldibacillus sp.]
MLAINLFLIILLIALTAFFVATEFAIVKVRPSRIDQLIAEGKAGAKTAREVVTHLDEYLSACQLGITITALGIGWLGEPTIVRLLEPLFTKLGISASIASVLSFIIAFSLVTYLHVVVGELAPKTAAIQMAEKITLLFSRPIILFYKLTYPFIWVLNGSGRLLVRLLGLNPDSEHEKAHTEEEIRLLLSKSYESGEINQSEFKYVTNVFDFDEMIAKEIMVPRTNIQTISINDSIDDVIEIIEEKGFTRYPVIKKDKDQIVGYINARELLIGKIKNKNLQLKDYIYPIIHVIETIPIRELLIKMQEERTQMAILTDEYGGTRGLVTVEDIIEEIVGEIRDEFDTNEIPDIQKVGENHYIVKGTMLIDDINDLLGTNLSNENVDTIGGWLLTENLNDNKNSYMEFGGYQFKVLHKHGHQIQLIEIKKLMELDRTVSQ